MADGLQYEIKSRIYKARNGTFTLTLTIDSEEGKTTRTRMGFGTINAAKMARDYMQADINRIKGNQIP